MTNDELIEIYEQAGLQLTGYDEDEEPMFLGTKSQWKKADDAVFAQQLSDQGEIK